MIAVMVVREVENLPAEFAVQIGDLVARSETKKFTEGKRGRDERNKDDQYSQ